MTITIESPDSESGLTEWLEFHDRVYESRDAHHLEFLPLSLPILTGESPFARRRRLRAFAARRGGDIVARAVAVVDERYLEVFGDGVGHFLLFEALPEAREATRLLADHACGWLRDRGLRFARAGMGMLEMPFVIDDYETLPPLGVRQNPPYYHAFLKDAGFETEKGLVDYRIEVTPELVTRYEDALESGRKAGLEIVPLRDVPPSERVGQFTDLYNRAFRKHWGFSPFSHDDLGLLLELQAPLGVLDLSVIAFRAGVPAGVLWVAGDASRFARLRPGRALRDTEKVNFLGIGVREEERGRGVNLTMAAFAYLELIRRGARWLSYTMVLDDNWPSRRTAEKLGGKVCASYVAYRRVV